MTLLGLADFLGLPWQIFGAAEDPYMLRIHLTPDRRWWRARLPGVAINCFFRGDLAREYHNHPHRWAFSFIVSGGYREFRKDGRYAPMREFILRPGMFNFVWKETYHRVELAPGEKCWTIWVMAPRDTPNDLPSDWGFTTEDGREYEHQTERAARVKRESART